MLNPISIVFEEELDRSAAYDRGVKILPVCSYAKRLMTGKEEFKDVLQ